MFGYIKPLQPQLRVCELDSYKAVYCGVCYGLSKRFGPLARCTLSYDFTFIAMLYAALHDEKPTFSPRRCPLNPFKHKPHLDYCEAVEFSCEMAILMLREKCVDNISDSSFIPCLGWSALYPVIGQTAKSVEQKYPNASLAAKTMTETQKKVESLGDGAGVDNCCNPTATALGELFSLMSADETVKRVLNRLGYMLGRYMYLCDAVDDLESDRKHNRFNPLKNCDDLDEQAAMLRFTAAEAANAYALLDIKHFKEILDNIIYMGLMSTANELIDRRRNKDE